jgi:hypothetical protein
MRESFRGISGKCREESPWRLMYAPNRLLAIHINAVLPGDDGRVRQQLWKMPDFIES